MRELQSEQLPQLTLNQKMLCCCCCCSAIQSCPTLCDPMNCSMPGFTVLHYLPEFAQTRVLLSLRCSPTSSSSHTLLLPSIFPSSGSFLMSQLFLSGGQSTRASASASVLSMNIQDQISFKIDWFDLHAVQGTLKSFNQHHSSKASILLALSLLCGPSITCIHDCWKKPQLCLCWQSNVSAF